jgi:hypothetical protein
VTAQQEPKDVEMAWDWHTALHEAAHAVVADALGFEVHSIRMTEDGPNVDHPGPDVPTEFERYMLAAVCYAGGCAEQQLTGDPPSSTVQSDLRQAHALLDGTDYGHARVARLAQSLVWARWGAIRSLAGTLLERKEADAEDVRTAVAEYHSG